LEGAAPAFGVPWTLNGTEYAAISADKLKVSERAMPGGKFREATLTIYVSLAVFGISGVKKGSTVICFGETVRVLEIEDDGDASRTLICGPGGVEVPRK
jgi:hypothetical protein